MGLNSTVNFISWLISSFIPMIIVSIVVAGKIEKLRIFKMNRGLYFSRSEIWWDFSCIGTHCHHNSITHPGDFRINAWVCIDRFFSHRFKLNFRSFRYLVSAFFTKANLATLCGILIYFISYLPFILIMFLEAKMQLGHKLLIVSTKTLIFISIFLIAFHRVYPVQQPLDMHQYI
jgi:hypothetical protein